MAATTVGDAGATLVGGVGAGGGGIAFAADATGGDGMPCVGDAGAVVVAAAGGLGTVGVATDTVAGGAGAGAVVADTVTGADCDFTTGGTCDGWARVGGAGVAVVGDTGTCVGFFVAVADVAGSGGAGVSTITGRALATELLGATDGGASVDATANNSASSRCVATITSSPHW